MPPRWRPFALAVFASAAALALASCAFFDRFRKEDPPLPGERIAVLQFERELKVDKKNARRAPLKISEAKNLTAWTQPGGVPSNAPYHIAGRSNLQTLFSREVVSGSTDKVRITAPPLVANGLFIALGAKLDLVAIDARTGAPRWRRDLRPAGGNLRTGFGGGIAVSEGVLYAVTGFGEVFALNLQTGAVRWRVQRRVPFRNAPAVHQGRIFVIGHDNRLQALSTKDGSVLWSHGGVSDSATLLAAPSVAVNDQLVIAGFRSGEVQSLRIANGLQNWTDTLIPAGQQVTPLSEINSIIGRPVLDLDRVFAVSHSGEMIAIDVRRGVRVWNADIASAQMPWVSGNVIYLVGLDNELFCINRANGSVRWVEQLPKRNLDGYPIQWTGPILFGGRLLLVSLEGEVRSLDPTTGKGGRIADLENLVELSPIAANGIVYILTDEGRVVALR